MRIGILCSSYRASADTHRATHAPFDPRRWLPGHTCEYHVLEKATAASDVRRLAQQGFDLFINLCDGYSEEPVAGPEVVRELERCGVPFTGCDSAGYEPTRQAMKDACQRGGIATPGHAFVSGVEDCARVAASLRFPLIVKHPRSYDSIGLLPASRVVDAEGLRAQVERMTRSYGGALVEEFVDGREFTVLCAEPRAGERTPQTYPPLEIVFPPGHTFKHFELKWFSYESMTPVSVEDPELAARLRDLTARMFTAMGATSYGRCDLRMNHAGELFMLEFNEIPCVFYPPETPGSADLILARDPAGHEGFLAHLIDCALRRARPSAPDSPTAANVTPPRGAGP
jgi:D-alanine-D-alanine ligase